MNTRSDIERYKNKKINNNNNKENIENMMTRLHR